MARRHPRVARMAGWRTPDFEFAISHARDCRPARSPLASADPESAGRAAQDTLIGDGGGRA
eukprot:15472186-Alexandrium_andersonii.AAC.1